MTPAPSQQYREGYTYLKNNADLLQNFHGQTGVFETTLLNNSPVFVVQIEDIPSRSPVATSITCTGTRNQWQITKLNEVEIETERSRSMAAGR